MKQRLADDRADTRAFGELGLRRLYYFVTLAEELHFAKAAERIGIAQPALSQQISGLERSVGAALFARTNRRVTLTSIGYALLPDARNLLREAERVTKSAKQLARGKSGRLRIGFVASGAYSILSTVLRRFRSECPGADLDINECGLRVPFDDLESGGLDVAIVRGPLEHPRLHVVPFFHEPLCAVVPEDHALAGRLTVRAAALAQEAFVLFPRHRAPHFYDALTRLCAEAGFSPNVRYEAADWQVMVSIIAAGLGVTLAPDSVRWLGRPGVSYVRLTPARKVAQLCLVHDVENSSPLKSIFIKVARSAAVRSQ